MFCWAPKNKGEGLNILAEIFGAFVTQLPPLALLEIDAGDDAHSPVGEDLGMVEACATVGGGELEAIEVVEAKEVLENVHVLILLVNFVGNPVTNPVETC